MYKDSRFDVVEAPVKPELTEEQKALFRAAEYIRHNGWCQGGVQAGARVCLVGSLYIGLGLKVSGCNILKIEPLLQKVQNVAEAHGICNLAEWNDAPGRTKEEVIALLEKAAAK